MTEKRKEAKNIGRVVEGLIKKWQTTGGEKGTAVKSAWDAAISKEARPHAQLVNYRNGVLTAIVDNSSWLYKLTLEKRNMLEKFNTAYRGRKKASDIRFRIGSTEA